MLSQQEYREKIRLQKDKIANLERVFESKISNLKMKKSSLETKSSLSSSVGFIKGFSEKAEQQIAELELINSQIEKLTSEKYTRINNEKRILNQLKDEYNSKKDGFEEDKKARSTKNKQEFKKSFERNKKKIVIGVIIVCAAIVAIVIAAVSHAVKISTEENRDYYISIDDKFTFDCNAEYDEQYKSISCEDRTISGTFSNYDTITFDKYNHIYGGTSSDYKVNGNNFEKELGYQVYTSLYETDDFNKDDLDTLESYSYISLYNTVLERDVFQKQIDIEYKLTEDDKNLIIQKHEDWKIWKQAEEERKAREEAEQKAKEAEDQAKRDAEKAESERKSTEEEAKRKAEEAAKAQAEQNKYKESNDGAEITDVAYMCARMLGTKLGQNISPHITTIRASAWTDNYTWVTNMSYYIDKITSNTDIGIYHCKWTYHGPGTETVIDVYK